MSFTWLQVLVLCAPDDGGRSPFLSSLHLIGLCDYSVPPFAWVNAGGRRLAGMFFRIGQMPGTGDQTLPTTTGLASADADGMRVPVFPGCQLVRRG